MRIALCFLDSFATSLPMACHNRRRGRRQRVQTLKLAGNMTRGLGHTKTQPPPPMRTWSIAVLYGIVLISTYQCVAQSVQLPTRDAFWRHNQRRVDRFAALTVSHPEDMRIVILGNSTIKYATDIDDASMTFPGVENVRVLRIVNNWANFTDFAPLTDAILALQPDVILFQADLLGRKQVLQRISNPALLQNYVKWHLVGDEAWNPEKINQDELQTDQVDYNDQSEARFARRIRSLTQWQTIDLDGQESELARQFVRQSAARDIPVVLHFTPVSDRARPLQRETIDELSPVVSRLVQDSASVTLLEYPSLMSDDQFGDFVHMNQNGRDEFMSWFVPELMAIARDGKGH